MDGLKSNLEKTWKVEYGYSFFRSVCPGCGLKIRELVRHVVIDYYNEDGSPHPINLNNSWHRLCHDQQCRHDFCVKQREERHKQWYIEVFGAHVVKVVKALGDMIKPEDVPKFLSSPHPELNGLSPLHTIWKFDRWGFERVMQIVERVASGAFI